MEPSVTKTLTSLMAIPANRSCADCRSTLVDPSHVYVSHSPEIRFAPRYNHFHWNHQRFAPPGYCATATRRGDDPPAIDPALLASQSVGPHGVFVCHLCAAAHQLLGPSITAVQAAQDTAGWSAKALAILLIAGGNQRATEVLEKYLPRSWERKRPQHDTPLADRLVFVRAKYEALSFVLPRAGPLATRAWRNIVQGHPELKGLVGTDILNAAELEVKAMSSTRPGDNTHVAQQARLELPNRLVDFFCVVTASDFLDPKLPLREVAKLRSPEDVLLLPKVRDCFPEQDRYEDTEFPEHLAMMSFPEGCRPRTAPRPPSIFTLALTTGSGHRLYGAVMTVYDDSRDIECLHDIFELSNYTGRKPLWLYCTAERSDVLFFPKCLVILSHYPFFDLWRKFLIQIYRISHVEAPLPIERYIANFCAEIPLPPPGRIRINYGLLVGEMWSIERPPENKLPLANFSFKPLFGCLSVSNVMVVFGCLLQELRVVVVSKHYSLLCPVCEALLSLLFPFHWQGMYVPVIPYSMIDLLEAPVPYLVGMHARYLTETPRERWTQGAVFVDLDQDAVHLGCEENCTAPRATPSLPERQATKLKTKLVEYASSVYLSPSEPGRITAGYGAEIPNIARDSYACVTHAEVSCNSAVARRKVLNGVDRAYRENEMTRPVSGFLAEQGNIHEQEKSSEVSKDPQNVKLVQFRFLRKASKASLDSASDWQPDVDGVFSHAEPLGYSETEIRAAFLRFFVSLFVRYRDFIRRRKFLRTDFIESLLLTNKSKAFMDQMLRTQLFDAFIRERMELPDDPEVKFFDESIVAKINRSRKAALAGKRRDTAFLQDLTLEVLEIFTPPPPSNWGLPDDGRSYRYASFPKLIPELYGKIRYPRAFVMDKPLRKLTSFQNSVVMEKEKALISRVMRATQKTRNNARDVTKRGVERLEQAFTTLSSPFATAPPETNRKKYDIIASRRLSIGELSLTTLDFGPEVPVSAEEVVLNARRKQVILAGIMIQFQAQCRSYLAKKHVERLRRQTYIKRRDIDFRELENSLHASAAQEIQAWYRGVRARRKFLLLRSLATQIKAMIKGRMTRIAFLFLRDAVTIVQALVRGRLLRTKFCLVMSQRLAVYKDCIFTLWQEVYVPLSYRSKFWPILMQARALRLHLAEVELRRLWVNVDSNLLLEDGIDLEKYADETVKISATIGLSSSYYLKAKKTLSCLSIRNCSSRSLPPSSREAAERLQIYERLSDPKYGHCDAFSSYYGKFGISRKEKFQKAALARTIWQNIAAVDASITLMLILFPELEFATNILYIEPSKKALRRIPTENPLPGQLPRELWAHEYLDNHIRSRITEIAIIGLHNMHDVREVTPRRAKTLLVNTQAKSMMEAKKIHDRRELRLLLMRDLVSCRMSTNSRPSEDTPCNEIKVLDQGESMNGYLLSTKIPNLTSIPLEDSKDNRSNGNVIIYPGDKFWESIS